MIVVIRVLRRLIDGLIMLMFVLFMFVLSVLSPSDVPDRAPEPAEVEPGRIDFAVDFHRAREPVGSYIGAPALSK